MKNQEAIAVAKNEVIIALCSFTQVTGSVIALTQIDLQSLELFL
ncbi:MAG: hypothetical protein VKL41_20615 [Snowella sp.]|nr:hypothetical protein [Snowella sp.]